MLATTNDTVVPESHVVHRKLTILALFTGFAGACFAFADSYRTSSRFSANGVSLGYGPEYTTWFWNHCGEIGFALIGTAFLIELLAALFCRAPVTRDEHSPQHAKSSNQSLRRQW